MSTSDPRTEAALSILIGLGSEAVTVSKPLRSGLTYSIVKAAKVQKRKLVVLSPTTRILHESVAGAANGDLVTIPGNNSCVRLELENEEFPILKDLPQILPNCRRCSLFGDCPITAILRVDNPQVIGLTYSKAVALTLSGTKTSRDILMKISEADYCLADECHSLVFPSVPSLPVSPLPTVPSEYKHLKAVSEAWTDILTENATTIDKLRERAGNSPTGHHLSVYLRVPEPLGWRSLRATWQQLRKLAKSGRMDRESILKIRDAIEILASPWAVAGWLSEDEGKSGQIIISASRGKNEAALTKFFSETVGHAGLIFGSATLIEPRPGFFAALSGREVKTETFPDILKTSAKVTLIPDTWRLRAGGFGSKLQDIISEIKQIAEREGEPIYLVGPNIDKSLVLKKAIDEAGIKDVFVDHYRSSFSMGVKRDEHVCICIGFAEIPSNGCDALADTAIGERDRIEGWQRSEDDKWIASQALRLQNVHASTWQAAGRVRDPEGKIESRVYFVGVRADQVKQLARWGPGRVAELVNIEEGRGADGESWRHPVFDIKIDTEVEHCKVWGEEMNRRNSERRSLARMIDQLEYYDEKKINSENDCISCIIVYTQNAVKLGFYNFPRNELELASNATSLYNTFVLRDDTYGQQSKNGSWSRVIGYCRLDVLLDHVNHKKTVGAYQISLDNEVVWGCIDIDTHHETEDPNLAMEKVIRIVDVLSVYGIPYLLEASGSPGSYHIWVLFKRTDTYNVFRFMRQLVSEAKLKQSEVEIFPKQKSLNSDSKYGNLVKLPLGYNNRTGAFSMFIDENFEPLEGEIRVPGRVVVVNIPKLTGDSPTMPKAKSEPKKSIVTDSLDFCMVKALEEKTPLIGTGGHRFRLAIAIKAINIGMDIEDIINLFRSQEDFKEETTRYQIESAREYKPFSCDTLRSCGEFASRWCHGCPFASPQLKGVAIP